MTFSKDKTAKTIINDPPVYNGKLMSVKRALAPKTPPSDLQYVNGVVKLFVGALPNKLKRKNFKRYFSKFGPIANIIFPVKDKETGTTSGHAFIEYKLTESVKIIADKTDGHYLIDKLVDIKISKPRNSKSPNYKAFQQMEKMHFGQIKQREGSINNSIENKIPKNQDAQIRQFKTEKKPIERKRPTRKFFNSKKEKEKTTENIKGIRVKTKIDLDSSSKEKKNILNTQRMSSPFIQKLGLEKELFESVETFQNRYSLFKNKSLITKQAGFSDAPTTESSWGLDID